MQTKNLNYVTLLRKYEILRTITTFLTQRTHLLFLTIKKRVIILIYC